MGNVKSIKDMAAKTRKKRSTHALFWELLKQTKGYQEQYKDVIKEGLVYNYSGGKTSSLSEMYSKYPGEYSLMIENMKGSGKQKAQRYDQSLDKERKRVIAAICAYVDKCKYVSPALRRKSNMRRLSQPGPRIVPISMVSPLVVYVPYMRNGGTRTPWILPGTRNWIIS